MRLIPNSWGSLREGNDCHNPAGSPGSTGGEFCSKAGASGATQKGSSAVEKTAQEVERTLGEFQRASKGEMSAAINRATGELLYTSDQQVEGEEYAGRAGVDDSEHYAKAAAAGDGNVLHYHTHPKGDDTAFSDGDWRRFSWSDVGEMRVVTQNHVYSLVKTDKFLSIPWQKRTPRALFDRWNALDAEMFDTQYKALNGDNLSFDEFTQRYTVALNQRMADELGVTFTIRKRT